MIAAAVANVANGEAPRKNSADRGLTLHDRKSIGPPDWASTGLDADRCYEAVLSRDRRFDGRFFAGVVTTGVYCRPICPVRPAKPENVRWFACAAAAEEAGFRPCRRCHPETSPGTPAWLGTSATISRALRLISEGALDSGTEEQLAERLGVGARHLRRLFSIHLGASPAAVALTRRVHFARRLIDESDLPMTEIASSSGFGSIRQFNQAIRASFQMAPTELRHKSHHPSAAGELALKLPYRPPFDWDAAVGFLGPRATPGVEAVGPDAYRRTIEVDGSCCVIEVRPVAGQAYLLLRLTPPNVNGLIAIVERVRRIFDLGADPLQILSHLRRDDLLADDVRASPGLRVPGAWDGFELAVRAILGQQVTVKGATTLAGRLVRAFGRPLPEAAPKGLTHLFPRPEVLAAADVSSVGLTGARAAAIRALGAAVASGKLRLEATTSLDDAVRCLTAIPGVGLWTAHYIAMRALGETDAFPATDLGLRRALSNGTGPISAAELERRADAWRPWRSYAALYLWRGVAKRRHVGRLVASPRRLESQTCAG